MTLSVWQHGLFPRVMSKEVHLHAGNSVSSQFKQTISTVQSTKLQYDFNIGFIMMINKAKTAYETVIYLINDHFVDVNKTIAIPKGTTIGITGFMLTRFAYNLIG